MVNLIEFILHILGRPKMYHIQKIEDFYYFMNGYIAGKENEMYYCFFDSFSKYLASEYQFKKDIPYSLMIRSMTIYDEETISILKREIESFLVSSFVESVLESKTDDKIKIEKKVIGECIRLGYR
ncbi:hypothetical protein [Flavobacterium chungangensis]|mgnify:CR=1 FL=1|uniref:Immunity protein 63 domain-containing protein n=1 Tax=Flavobacterium chungangensis TaxID=2708132 RepID=A0ABV8ZBM9_9FLAO